MRTQICLALIGITLWAIGGCASRQSVPSPQPLQQDAGTAAAPGAAPSAKSGEPTGGSIKAGAAGASNPLMVAVPLAMGATAPAGSRTGNRAVYVQQARGAKGRALEAGNGATAHEIPDGSDDDIIAVRLRRAAENETDPDIKGKLWKEYVDYRSYTER